MADATPAQFAAEQTSAQEAELPLAVSVELAASFGSYCVDRLRQVFTDFYAGVPMAKFPEDLRVYEHLMWATRTNVVVELGTNLGGSALWFRDRLATMARYRRIPDFYGVYSVDLWTAEARKRLDAADPANISLIQGDVCDPELPARIADQIPADARVFVIEDSAHNYETTTAALGGYAHLVPNGGYFVVEDGAVDIDAMRLTDEWPRGVIPAVTEWLTTEQGSEFVLRRDLERYGLTCHPHGFLQRVRAAPGPAGPTGPTGRLRRGLAGLRPRG